MLRHACINSPFFYLHALYQMDTILQLMNHQQQQQQQREKQQQKHERIPASATDTGLGCSTITANIEEQFLAVLKGTRQNSWRDSGSGMGVGDVSSSPPSTRSKPSSLLLPPPRYRGVLSLLEATMNEHDIDSAGGRASQLLAG